MTASRFSLPAIPLLFSVIFSSAIIWLTLPQARTAPLSLSLAILTVAYHSLLLLSSLLNRSRKENASFHIHPSKLPQILCTFCLAAFWLSSYSSSLKFLNKGSSQPDEINYMLAFLSLAEWLSNAYLTVQSLAGLQDLHPREVDPEDGYTCELSARSVHTKSSASCAH